jgi:acetyl esterase
LALLHKGRAAGPAVARVEDFIIKGADRPVPARLYAAVPRPIAIMVFCHGGGWVLGSVEDTDAHTRRIAVATDCAVLSVDYRLAPENPYPAALRDVMAALHWAAAHARDIAGAKVPLILAGDSSGGNLAAAAALYACDHGGPKVAMQILGYPALAARFDTSSYEQYADGPILSRADMKWFWTQYVTDAVQWNDPYVAPLHAPSLAGLPATYILTAECDPLRDDGEQYAQKLAAAGVMVQCKRYAGMIHGFYRMADMLAAGREAHDDVAAFIRRHI